jgi:energy-converting hydrogenase Eha subunit G
VTRKDAQPPKPSFDNGLLITIGKMLADIESLKAENGRMWRLIYGAGGVAAALLFAVIAFFFRNPDKWRLLAEFLK